MSYSCVRGFAWVLLQTTGHDTNVVPLTCFCVCVCVCANLWKMHNEHGTVFLLFYSGKSLWATTRHFSCNYIFRVLFRNFRRFRVLFRDYFRYWNNYRFHMANEVTISVFVVFSGACWRGLVGLGGWVMSHRERLHLLVWPRRYHPRLNITSVNGLYKKVWSPSKSCIRKSRTITSTGFCFICRGIVVQIYLLRMDLMLSL